MRPVWSAESHGTRRPLRPALLCRTTHLAVPAQASTAASKIACRSSSLIQGFRGRGRCEESSGNPRRAGWGANASDMGPYVDFPGLSRLQPPCSSPSPRPPRRSAVAHARWVRQVSWRRQHPPRACVRPPSAHHFEESAGLSGALPNRPRAVPGEDPQGACGVSYSLPRTTPTR